MKINDNKLVKYLFLLLFLGYYGSITLFYHAHIVDGVTIVHSHPFSSDSGGKSGGHQHSAKVLAHIQLLSHFIATLAVFAIALNVLRPVLNKMACGFPRNFVHPYLDAYTSLRAPPSLIHI